MFQFRILFSTNQQQKMTKEIKQFGFLGDVENSNKNSVECGNGSDSSGNGIFIFFFFFFLLVPDKTCYVQFYTLLFHCGDTNALETIFRSSLYLVNPLTQKQWQHTHTHTYSVRHNSKSIVFDDLIHSKFNLKRN